MPGYFEFEVSLRGIQPRMWRRFLLRDSVPFIDLHVAIQAACDWRLSHSFGFFDGKGRPIATYATWDAVDQAPPGPDAEDVRLKAYFGKAESCLYVYDFGDNWHHDVKMVRHAVLPQKFLRKLTAGEYVFPLEDSGGVNGFLEPNYDSPLRKSLGRKG